MQAVESPVLGGVAAALVAAAAGAAACGVFYVLAATNPLRAYFNLYAPAGALSGVSTAAILVWLATWALLSRRWSGKAIDMQRVSWVATGLLLLGLLLTFPPVARLL